MSLLAPVLAQSAADTIPRELDCQVETTFSCLETSRRTWDEAVADLGGSIYMSYDWASTWWSFYGVGKDLRIFTFRLGARIVGIVPIYIDSIGFGPLKFKVARLVGANIPPKVFNVAMDQQWAGKMFEKILVQILEKDRCDLLSFGPISELQGIFSELEIACQQNKHLAGRFETVTGVHSVFWMPANMEEYYTSLSKNERKHRRKYELRLLRKEFQVEVDVVREADQVEDEFGNFAPQHALQWRAEGKTGHFGAWPRALEFNRALVKVQGKLGRLRFIRIRADGEVIANQYTFAFGDAYYWELPSRAVDAKWERFSLGPTGIVTMIEVALGEGKTRIEGGLAHYDYKVRLGAKEYGVKTFRIGSARFGSILRLYFYCFFRRVLELLYHKIWYRRILPRLPALFWRPQWELWLRFDF